MVIRLKIVSLMISLINPLGMAWAASDLSDVEDISLESEGALAQTQDVRERLTKEQNAATKAFQAAEQARQNSLNKQRAAVDQMKRSEAEIQDLIGEQNKMKAEVEKLNKETANAEKITQDEKVKIEKAKAELQTLKDLRDEKSKKLLLVLNEQDKISLELKDLERKKIQAETDFHDLKEQEKVATEKYQKMKLEETQQKAKVEAYLAGMKEMSAQTQNNTNVVQRETAAAQAATAASEMTLKRDCRIFDKPSKGLKVVGMKFSGTTIRKTAEGSNWLGFTLTDGQQGFLAKTCF